jgi:hypothetical protein
LFSQFPNWWFAPHKSWIAVCTCVLNETRFTAFIPELTWIVMFFMVLGAGDIECKKHIPLSDFLITWHCWTAGDSCLSWFIKSGELWSSQNCYCQFQSPNHYCCITQLQFKMVWPLLAPTVQNKALSGWLKYPELMADNSCAECLSDLPIDKLHRMSQWLKTTLSINATMLLGPSPKGTNTWVITVTLPSKAADDNRLTQGLLVAGTNVVRVWIVHMIIQRYGGKWFTQSVFLLSAVRDPMVSSDGSGRPKEGPHTATLENRTC